MKRNSSPCGALGGITPLTAPSKRNHGQAGACFLVFSLVSLLLLCAVSGCKQDTPICYVRCDAARCYPTCLNLDPDKAATWAKEYSNALREMDKADTDDFEAREAAALVQKMDGGEN